MAKSTIRLPNGTEITVDGSAEEIKAILLSVSTTNSSASTQALPERASPKEATSQASSEVIEDIVQEVVIRIKNHAFADAIGANILDKKSLVNRVLLPLFVVHEEVGGTMYITSGEIRSVLKELGISASLPNISNTLSGSASKYVMKEKRVIKGGKGKYRLTRPGVQYVKALLA